MGTYKEINGDLIQLTLEGNFDCIAHGVNCFSTQKSGIAKQMVKHFKTDEFQTERRIILNDETKILKLGHIDWQVKYKFVDEGNPKNVKVTVINAYTQYEYGIDKVNLDYLALGLCMRKINKIFAGKHIGLPQIGCGLAGGQWSAVKNIIQKELKDMNVTIVIYDK